MNQDEVYSAIEQLRRRGERGVLATVTEIRGSSPAGLGSKMLIVEGRGRAFGTVGGGCVDGQVWTAAPRVLERGLPETLEIDLTDHDDDPDHGLICGGIVSVFLEPLQSERLVICGAGHIGEALAAFAGRLGYHITVIDDRASFASPERFADSVELRVGAFEDQLATLELNAACSAVIVTRGHRYDEACLRALVDQPLRYLGLIGSRSKISKLFARLAKDGVDPNQLAAVRAPIGLDIGAVTVDEIALSVAAELVAMRRLGREIPRELAAERGPEPTVLKKFRESPAPARASTAGESE